MKKDKDELYFFILLIDYVPFRSFWELLCYNNKVYNSFQEVWEERGLIYIRDSGVHNNNDNKITNIDRNLSLFSSEKLLITILEYKKLIANMCRTIDVILEIEYIFGEFRECGVKNSKMFRELYLDLKRKG